MPDTGAWFGKQNRGPSRSHNRMLLPPARPVPGRAGSGGPEEFSSGPPLFCFLGAECFCFA